MRGLLVICKTIQSSQNINALISEYVIEENKINQDLYCTELQLSIVCLFET